MDSVWLSNYSWRAIERSARAKRHAFLVSCLVDKCLGKWVKSLPKHIWVICSILDPGSKSLSAYSEPWRGSHSLNKAMKTEARPQERSGQAIKLTSVRNDSVFKVSLFTDVSVSEGRDDNHWPWPSKACQAAVGEKQLRAEIANSRRNVHILTLKKKKKPNPSLG